MLPVLRLLASSRRGAVLAGVGVASLLTLAGEAPAHALAMKNATQAWPGGTVPVCFTSQLEAQPNFAQFYAAVRTNVENTWARVADLRFTGWGTCPASLPAGTAVLFYQPGGFNTYAPLGYTPDAGACDAPGHRRGCAPWASSAGRCGSG